MAERLANWLNDRTGYRDLIIHAFNVPLPGGARWRYVFGSALSAAFFIMAATGVLLMTAYSPSSSTAWGSVYYINEQMTCGWIIRGIHHFGAQSIVVLLVLHLVQVLISGAYRAPREVNWWFGIALMFLVLVMGHTGYLLPWDQKGFWATKVATGIVSSVPVIGGDLSRVLIGGNDYGNQTLTRFFALHVAIIPGLLILTLIAHVALFRRHGPTPPGNGKAKSKSHSKSKSPEMGSYWPDQTFRNAVAGVAVLGFLLFLTFWNGGAHLDAPSDPGSGNYPARPEWYFLFMFQLLKNFGGTTEVVGTVVIPGTVMLVMLLIPLFDRVMSRGVAHFVACGFVFAVLGSAGYLTYLAVKADANNLQFQQARAEADVAQHRALQLATAPDYGIAPEGASYLLRRDPLTQGRAVLESKCLSCHVYNGTGQTAIGEDGKPRATSQQTASDLAGFGTKAWLAGMLANPNSTAYFGTTPQCGGMKRWKASSKLTPEQLKDVTDFVADFAKIPATTSAEEWAATLDPKTTRGLESFIKDCGRCHVVGSPGLLTEGGEEEAPNLFAWGSPQWVDRMVRKPGAPENYAHLEEPQRMPAFNETSLTENDMQMIIRYMNGDFLPLPKNPNDLEVKTPVPVSSAGP